MAGSRRNALLALVLAGWAGAAQADGGVVVASGPVGALRASVLVSPAPLRSGPTEWSVLLQDAGGAPVLDAEVELELHRPGGSGGHHARRVVSARREASANRLLSIAVVDLPEPGTWRVALRVMREEGGRLDFEVPVGPARGRAAAHWRALALPPVALGLFALHQWLSRRERRRARRNPRA